MHPGSPAAFLRVGRSGPIEFLVREAVVMLSVRSTAKGASMRFGASRPFLGLVAVMLVLAACSGAEVAEKVIESQEGVGDIEIEENDGTVALEFEDEEGTVSGVFGGGEIPADFPVPVPDGGTVTAVLTQAGNTSVALSYAQSEFESLKSFYADYVEGKTVLLEAASADPPAATWIVEVEGGSINITVADSGSTTEVVIAVVSDTG